MSVVLHRVTKAWGDYRIDPCAKTLLMFAHVLSQHRYDPKWPCHAWIHSGKWCESPWKSRLHAALLSSLRTSTFADRVHDDILFDRLCRVAKWIDNGQSLKNIVAVDAWCSLEWWVLGRWLDKKQDTLERMPELVSMWNPVFAFATPLYAHLGWRNGLQSLYNSVNNQREDAYDQIDGSIFESAD